MATAGKLVFQKFGNPTEELSIVQEPIPTELAPGQAHVKVLLAPVNPADVMTVAGHYAWKPQLPAVPGLEAVAEVVKSSTGAFQPGDRVLVMTAGWGTWRQHGVAPENDLVRLPKELPLEAAATLIVNPVTAYLMVNHIVSLQPGDSLIQNAANSALGQIVIQLAKAKGIKTINVVRNRSNLQEVVDTLKALGADAVITDEQLKKGLQSLNLGLPAPKLALECVGGDSALDLIPALANGGTLSTYGVLTGKPLNVPQGDLIFRDIKVRGFWLSAWIGSNSAEDFGKVLKDIISLYVGGKLQLPKFRKFPIIEFKEAIKHATQGFTNEKVLIQFN